MQQGQVFRLRATAANGDALWATGVALAAVARDVC